MSNMQGASCPSPGAEGAYTGLIRVGCDEKTSAKRQGEYHRRDSGDQAAAIARRMRLQLNITRQA